MLKQELSYRERGVLGRAFMPEEARREMQQVGNRIQGARGISGLVVGLFGCLILFPPDKPPVPVSREIPTATGGPLRCQQNPQQDTEPQCDPPVPMLHGYGVDYGPTPTPDGPDAPKLWTGGEE